MNALAITIANIAINQDNQGRYCLNDLHKAAGSESKHQPAFFMRRNDTKELIAEISSANSQTIPVETITGKNKEQGTYVVKELVYAYAMWISPAFSLKVIRTFDALVNTPHPDDELVTLTIGDPNAVAVTWKIPEPPADLNGPITYSQFQSYQDALNLAQKNLLNAQITLSAADLLSLKGKPGKAKKAIAVKRWSPEDSLAAQEMQAKGYGPTHIAKLIGGRTVNSVKNHLTYLAKKQGGAA